MDIPDEPIKKKENVGTKLVSYAHVNVAFDEESPVVKYARRESLHSVKSAASVKIFAPHKILEEQNNELNNCDVPTDNGGNFRPTPPTKCLVKVRGATKRYGRSGPLVMDNFSMTVEKGTIYSLLGASGCGKTTALTCILGMRKLDKGNISVFGKRPGSPGSDVPGNRVGYMPQELALYGDFSIDETLRYYGSLFGMSTNEVKASREFIMSYLNLHDESRRVKELSSGQKRRVSLAVALIHSPELVVLDEPTVGVDALLREKIWEHLVWLVKEHGTTVIITTHYIEEARHSNMIGLMRGGRLLAENDPAALMRQHNATLLEDIVLKLCRNDEFQSNTDDPYLKNGVQMDRRRHSHDKKDGFDDESTKRRQSIYSTSMSVVGVGDNVMHRPSGMQKNIQRIRGLILKNAFVMWRNIFLVLFMIMTPSFMVFLICNGIGNDPKPINLGVVNHESNFSHCATYENWRITDESDEVDKEEGCDLDYLSCKFINRIPKDIVILKEYDSEELARAATEIGDIWGYISLPEGYSDNVYTRTSSGNRVDEDALDGSFITYQLDMSNKIVSGFIKKLLFDSFEEFIKLMLTNCGLNEKLGDRPLKKLDPIYGSDDTDLREFMVPSLLVGFLFFFPLCSSSVQFIYDQKQGTLERARVAGVQTSEIMIAYFVTESVVVIIQIATSLVIIIFLFEFEIRGSLLLIILQYILMGLGGVSAGFLLASICTEEVEAVLLAMAAFFPNFLLSGLLWPIEGMPLAMQYATYILPATFPAETVRSILSRGWGFTHLHVWPGFMAAILWLLVYWGTTLAIHKIILNRK